VLSDPIVALATPPGRSAVALIRLSGRGAFDVAARALHPFHPDPPRTVRRVHVVHPATGAPVDDALAACFRGPRSYTGEDLVELSTHGGLLVPAAAVAALVAAGARPARPGEFTRRAVLNGKLDLLQAEATADLIDADSPAQARRALHQLDRGRVGHEHVRAAFDVLLRHALGTGKRLRHLLRRQCGQLRIGRERFESEVVSRHGSLRPPARAALETPKASTPRRSACSIPCRAE